MRIVFCSDAFPAAHTLLRARRPHDDICIWHQGDAVDFIRGTDVLIPMMVRIDAAVMDAIQPRLIHQWGSGLEGVDLDAARMRDIPVARVPAAGNNAESVAEHTLLLILSLLRQMPAAQASVRAGILGAPAGRMLAGRTVCLWGLGATATALARRLRAFDVTLLGVTRDPSAHKVRTFDLDACYSTADRETALGRCDVLVLCLRLGHETLGIVDTSVFEALPHGAYLVNTSRGPLIDRSALLSALSSGRLAGAGLDVFWQEPTAIDDPLLTMPGVIATPHIAGVTVESYEQIADAVAANMARLHEGAPILNRVN